MNALARHNAARQRPPAWERRVPRFLPQQTASVSAADAIEGAHPLADRDRQRRPATPRERDRRRLRHDRAGTARDRERAIRGRLRRAGRGAAESVARNRRSARNAASNVVRTARRTQALCRMRVGHILPPRRSIVRPRSGNAQRGRERPGLDSPLGLSRGGHHAVRRRASQRRRGLHPSRASGRGGLAPIARRRDVRRRRRAAHVGDGRAAALPREPSQPCLRADALSQDRRLSLQQRGSGSRGLRRSRQRRRTRRIVSARAP